MLATYKAQLAAADQRANALAANRDLQRALAAWRSPQLRKLVAANPGVRLETPTLQLGPARMIAPGTRVAIVNSSSVVGTLVVGCPADDRRARAPTQPLRAGFERPAGRAPPRPRCRRASRLDRRPACSGGSRRDASGGRRPLSHARHHFPGRRRQPGARLADAAGRDRRRGHASRQAAADRAARLAAPDRAGRLRGRPLDRGLARPRSPRPRTQSPAGGSTDASRWRAPTSSRAWGPRSTR